ncbi:hypothetical protein [Herbaspirillum rubrisubalbicans]|uniref:hypothetical protein n=1 Tax=Herbaspirillum rubrisubalbicans TaxID=80842 RepID=UPI0015ECC618|nr:hypothetical protein [Herbaspirillum rubrisubalbicans]
MQIKSGAADATQRNAMQRAGKQNRCRWHKTDGMTREEETGGKKNAPQSAHHHDALRL